MGSQCCHTQLCYPVDYNPPGSSIHGVFKTRILEWVSISFSRGSSWPRATSPTLAGRFFTTASTWETLEMSFILHVFLPLCGTQLNLDYPCTLPMCCPTLELFISMKSLALELEPLSFQSRNDQGFLLYNPASMCGRVWEKAFPSFH